MTKKEFAKILFESGAFPSKAEAERKVDLFLDTIEDTLVGGEDLNFIGWGKFELVERGERVGRNPKTGEEIKIEAKKSVKFKPGKSLIDKIN